MRRLHGVGFLAGLLLLVGLLSVHYVPVNSVGVRYNRASGAVSETPVTSGVKFKAPLIQEIKSVSTELRGADVDDINVTTKDAQTANIDIELQYHVLPENATDTFKQFKSVKEEDWIKTFVYQRIQRGVQESASKYTVSELRGDKRGEFQRDVDETVKEALDSNFLTLQSVTVDAIKVSDSILKSIEAHAKAQQDVRTAEETRNKQKVENETKIEKEEAEAKVKKIQAEAEADANKKIGEGITAELIKYLEAEARKEHGWYKYNNMEPTIIEEGK